MDGIIDSMDRSLGGLPELVLVKEVWRAAVHGVTNSRRRLRDSTELKDIINVQLTYRSRNVNTRERILGDHNPAYHFHIHESFVF